VDRLKKLSESEGRRALEGWGQRWNFGGVAERKHRQQWQQTERNKEPNEERGEKRHPGGSVCAGSVRNEQRNEDDHDGRDRYPEPDPLLAK
jgi:hypothetical protein